MARFENRLPVRPDTKRNTGGYIREAPQPRRVVHASAAVVAHEVLAVRVVVVVPAFLVVAVRLDLAGALVVRGTDGGEAMGVGEGWHIVVVVVVVDVIDDDDEIRGVFFLLLDAGVR